MNFRVFCWGLRIQCYSQLDGSITSEAAISGGTSATLCIPCGAGTYSSYSGMIGGQALSAEWQCLA